MLLLSMAHADVGGKNVILIHGFNPFHIVSPPSDNGKADAMNYWKDINPAFVRQGGQNSNIIHWPSHKRLTGSGGIISIVQPQIQALLNENYCADQCVIVTHSTGDLVARFLVKNKTSIFGSAQASKLKIAAVIDLAGAGGGTELANFGVGISNGVNFGGSIISGLLEYAGFYFRFGLDVGVMNDLQTSVARNHATNGFPAVPHLRVAGTGSEVFGFATHPIIHGADDSVVPLHSACGAAYASSYDSCSRDTRPDGKLTYVSKAPSASQLYDYHYPIIMSEGIAHNEMQTNKTGNTMTSIRSVEATYKNGNAYTQAINIDDYEKREWWDWWSKYRYISGSKSNSVSTMLVNSVM
ncbi:hypothetical protein QWZ13_07840 [Reinekea marina]|uniref:hypothetical protein n=1 Tax=Reinekea marina TaxID=1310421 RepID=UPI0025B3C960|nr:hypothetical protein [Reinekea marina]MDN3648819.1 hypothetical protein [Reinekea marina]